MKREDYSKDRIDVIIYGFQLNDRVKVDGKMYFLTSRLSTGQFFMQDLQGNKKSKMWKNITLVSHQHGYLVEKVAT